MKHLSVSLIRVGLILCLGTAVLAASPRAARAQALQPSSYDQQLREGQAALAAGMPAAALNAGDAAVRTDPQRWDGYALAGQALLQLKRYEAAADALSKAIERAPESEQAMLRQWRRQSLLAESGAEPPAGPAALSRSTAPSAASRAPSVASSRPAAAASAVSPPAAPTAAAVPPQPPPSSAPSVGSGRVAEIAREAYGAEGAVWLDPSTSLTWARPWYYARAATAPWNFAEAQNFCANLVLLGYSDWRLPTVAELQHVYLPSRKGWRWSTPKFAPGYGVEDALKHGQWQPAAFDVADGRFAGNRLLIWSSTPGDGPAEHQGVYFGRAYSVKDDLRVGISLGDKGRRDPFQGFALCVRSAN